MSHSEGKMAKFVLRFASPLAGLRRVPVLGAALSWVGGKLVPRESLTWVQVRHGLGQGLWLRLYPRTGRGYFEGGSELEVQEALQKHLRPGMTFYDVGANIGFFTLVAARVVGNSGRVVAFEADPEIAERLREHVAGNKFDWVVVKEKAVWSSSGPLRFARADRLRSPDRGLGHVVSDGEMGSISTDGISLDDCVLTETAPDFLKCDVEGAEVEVFRGAQRLLKERRPIIICEMHTDEARRTLVEEFSRFGYRCSDCGENHVLALPE